MLSSPIIANRRFLLAAAAILLLSLLRVASTHLVFSQTLDEPAHVAAGHEWLLHGHYLLDFEHPPLPRVLFALPFIHVQATHLDDKYEYGSDLYAADGRYIHNVAAARRPNLLFFAIACIALTATARRLLGDAAALIALLLFVSLPPVLAHAGLATTDMAGTAAFALALYVLLRWCDDPSWRRSILLGLAIAFGVCCKYSFLFFFPVTMVIVLVGRRRLAPARLLTAGLVAAIAIWGAFGFSFATIAETNPDAPHMARDGGFSERVIHVPLPAPDLMIGLMAVRVHNRAGHFAFLLGRTSPTGWWYYFPVALAVKTPIPYLLLALCGSWLLFVRRHPARFLVVIAAAILLIGMASRINIGVRHILPIYIPLSIAAAFAVVELWPRAAALRVAVAAALAWLVVSSVAAHPDYLPWMNAFAGRRPERVLLDSNFDWGQDVWRLARICQKRGITSLGFALNTGVRGTSVGITSGYFLDENLPSRGWMVISEEKIVLARVRNPVAYEWLTAGRKYERVGKTLRLYRVP